MPRRTPRIGLALGGGAARGWAHIGAIRALNRAGIFPDVVCGTSIGALVGAVYASGELDWLEHWVSSMTWRTVVRMLDLRLSGGLIGGKKLIQLFGGQFGDRKIEDLAIPFAAVATELDSGREVWLQDGAVIDAVRASIAIPGLFTPFLRDGVWLVDGGLSNPVPVSVARAMRADFVIAIDLNSDLLSVRDLSGTPPVLDPLESKGHDVANRASSEEALAEDSADSLAGELAPPGSVNLSSARRVRTRKGERAFRHWILSLGESPVRAPPTPRASAPSMLSSMAQSIDIMQVRISRSRLAGEPADVHISPRLGGMGIFDFHRAVPSIAAGRLAVERMMPAIEANLAGYGRNHRREN